MHIYEQAIPLLENIFAPGEQTIISMAQAQAIRDVERFEATLLTIFLMDHVDNVDYQLKAVKLKVRSPDTEEYVWAQRVTKLFKVAGDEFTTFVTKGSETTRSTAKSIRAAMAKLDSDKSFEQTGVVIYDHELQTMYHGWLVGFHQPHLETPRKSKKVKDD